MNYNYDVIVYDKIRRKELTKKGTERIRIRTVAKERLTMLNYDAAFQFCLVLYRKRIPYLVIRTKIKNNIIEFCGYGLVKE
jgi:hypothetical protein